MHSLFELRSHLLNGGVILDLEAQTLEQIVDSACNYLLEIDCLVKDEHIVDRVKEILLRRHIHQHERHRTDKQKHGLPLIRSLADIGRNPSKSMFGSYGKLFCS